MRVRERVIASRILEMTSENQNYAHKIGISAALRKIGQVHDGYGIVNSKTENNSELQLKAHNYIKL